MRRDVIICTVGTSLLTNLRKGSSSIFESKNAVSAINWLKRFDPKQRECGAEINSIASIAEKEFIDGANGLYLLISDTDDGEFTGRILKGYYQSQSVVIRADRERKKKFKDISVRRIPGLHDQDFKSFRNRGLRNLVKEISSIIKWERSRGHEPIINATGGFKAQISFAGLIGQTLRVPVYYMFERFTEVIEMPPMPVSFDFSLWLEHFDLLDELSRGDLPVSDQRLCRVDPRLDPLLFRVDEDVTLSAMGELFHEGFLYQFAQHGESILPPDSEKYPEEKKRDFGKDHHKPKGVETYFDKLARVPYVTCLQMFYSNIDLAERNCFWLSSHDFDRVEGCYSDGKGTCKFNVYLTSTDKQKAQAAVADLSRRFCAS